jgi:hypothetical protein
MVAASKTGLTTVQNKTFVQKKIKKVKKKKDFFEKGRISINSKYFLQNK